MADPIQLNSASFYDQLQGTTTETSKAGSQDLDQSDFLSLMTTQLQSQSPLDPMDNQAFVAQMAQFSTVGGIAEMVSAVENLSSSMQSNRALEASVLVGRDVFVNSGYGHVGDQGEGIGGSVVVNEAVTALNVHIKSLTGELLDSIALGPTGEGNAKFTWDGLDSAGNPVAEGLYEIVAEGTTTSAGVVFPTLIKANIDSVSLNGGQQAMTLNLAGLGAVSVDDVEEIS